MKSWPFMSSLQAMKSDRHASFHIWRGIKLYLKSGFASESFNFSLLKTLSKRKKKAICSVSKGRKAKQNKKKVNRGEKKNSVRVLWHWGEILKSSALEPCCYCNNPVWCMFRAWFEFACSFGFGCSLCLFIVATRS